MRRADRSPYRRAAEAVEDRHEVVEQIGFLFGRGGGNHDPARLPPERNIEPAEPNSRQPIVCSTTNVPNESAFNTAVSFSRVSFTPETTSLITAATDKPSAFGSSAVPDDRDRPAGCGTGSYMAALSSYRTPSLAYTTRNTWATSGPITVSASSQNVAMNSGPCGGSASHRWWAISCNTTSSRNAHLE